MATDTQESGIVAMQATLVAMQIQQGRIESTLNIVVTQHERRIEENSRETRQLRIDLEAVKDNANKRIDTHIENTNKAFEKERQRITENAGAITDFRNEISRIWAKLDSTGQRAVLIISPILTGVGLVLTFVGVNK